MPDKEEKLKEEVDVVFSNRRIEVGYTKTIKIEEFIYDKLSSKFTGDIKDGVDVILAFDQAYQIVDNSLITEMKERKLYDN